MFLADSHTHTLCSIDAYNSTAEMVSAAINFGLASITITDHVDLDYYLSGKRDPYCFYAWPDMLEDFCEAGLLYGKDISLQIGLELGEANHHPDAAREIAQTPGLDFIIGSLHGVRDTLDFCFYDYTSHADCIRLIEKYLAEHLELAAMPDIDVIGHIGYTRRYMKKAGFDIDLSDYTDALREIFKTAAQNGRGIELNMSGLRQGLGTPIPNINEVRLYRECGGEIITVGSDAHRPEDVGSGIQEGYKWLREVGFQYVTVFKNRKPQFIKL